MHAASHDDAAKSLDHPSAALKSTRAQAGHHKGWRKFLRFVPGCEGAQLSKTKEWGRE